MREKLEIYDELRRMHRELRAMIARNKALMDTDHWAKNALEAVDSVLYLAEGVFAKE